MVALPATPYIEMGKGNGLPILKVLIPFIYHELKVCLNVSENLFYFYFYFAQPPACMSLNGEKGH